jgi:hypothetical protein
MNVTNAPNAQNVPRTFLSFSYLFFFSPAIESDHPGDDHSTSFDAAIEKLLKKRDHCFGTLAHHHFPSLSLKPLLTPIQHLPSFSCLSPNSNSINQ